MALVIKNTDNVSHIYVGMTIEPNSSYTVQGNERILWANCDELLEDIANSKAQVNDGSVDIAGVSNQINFLKDIDMNPRDSDGSPLQRVKITTTGWHYRLHGVEFETSKLNYLKENKANNTSFAFSTIKFYELLNGNETEITGGNLTQAYLDANCIKTVLDWEPNHDYEVMGGMLKQIQIPSTDVMAWVVGVPDVPEAYGGSREFCTNVNMRYINSGDSVKVDGRAPKYLTYSATNHTNKMRLIFRHDAGFKHKMLMLFEIFKA